MKKKDGPQYFVVEEGIPMPDARAFSVRRQKRNIYPFADLRVGDSFLVPGEYGGRVHQSAVTWLRRRGLPWKFATRRTEDGGYRIWRVE